jgi:hypothetical protein
MPIDLEDLAAKVAGSLIRAGLPLWGLQISEGNATAATAASRLCLTAGLCWCCGRSTTTSPPSRRSRYRLPHGLWASTSGFYALDVGRGTAMRGLLDRRPLPVLVSMPSISGGALRLSTCTSSWPTGRSSFYALDVGRGAATAVLSQLTVWIPVFLCPRCRAGRCDTRASSTCCTSTGRFYALDVGRGAATACQACSTMRSTSSFLCPRCRAGRCDEKVYRKRVRVQYSFLCPRCRAGRCDEKRQLERQQIDEIEVSMPSMSGWALRPMQVPAACDQGGCTRARHPHIREACRRATSCPPWGHTSVDLRGCGALSSASGRLVRSCCTGCLGRCGMAIIGRSSSPGAPR